DPRSQFLDTNNGLVFRGGGAAAVVADWFDATSARLEARGALKEVDPRELSRLWAVRQRKQAGLPAPFNGLMAQVDGFLFRTHGAIALVTSVDPEERSVALKSLYFLEKLFLEL